jgi:hypothetical protein
MGYATVKRKKEAGMRGGADDLDERFAAFVRGHGERHLRLAVLLTGDWHRADFARFERHVSLIRL